MTDIRTQASRVEEIPTPNSLHEVLGFCAALPTAAEREAALYVYGLICNYYYPIITTLHKELNS
jgi:hypothetical protein